MEFAGPKAGKTRELNDAFHTGQEFFMLEEYLVYTLRSGMGLAIIGV